MTSFLCRYGITSLKNVTKLTLKDFSILGFSKMKNSGYTSAADLLVRPCSQLLRGTFWVDIFYMRHSMIATNTIVQCPFRSRRSR